MLAITHVLAAMLGAIVTLFVVACCALAKDADQQRAQSTHDVHEGAEFRRLQ